MPYHLEYYLQTKRRSSHLLPKIQNLDDKLMKYFSNAVRPLQLHQKVKEKMHKCSTLAEVYQLALLEEKELARLRKLRKEENEKKGVRKIEVDKPDKPTPKRNNNRYNQNNNNNSSKKDQIPLIKQTTNWLVQNHRCAFCTKPINDNNHPHSYEDCKAKYPFYRAKEVRELTQAKKEIPARTTWPEDNRSKSNSKNVESAANHLKGQAGLNL